MEAVTEEEAEAAAEVVAGSLAEEEAAAGLEAPAACPSASAVGQQVEAQQEVRMVGSWEAGLEAAWVEAATTAAAAWARAGSGVVRAAQEELSACC